MRNKRMLDGAERFAFELNEAGTCLLFSDKKKSLYLVNENETNELINAVKYAQWVPRSNVIVAQTADNLVVWYNAQEHRNSSKILIKVSNFMSFPIE